jgi:hypothetical protein
LPFLAIHHSYFIVLHKTFRVINIVVQVAETKFDFHKGLVKGLSYFGSYDLCVVFLLVVEGFSHSLKFEATSSQEFHTQGLLVTVAIVSLVGNIVELFT